MDLKELEERLDPERETKPRKGQQVDQYVEVTAEELAHLVARSGVADVGLIRAAAAAQIDIDAGKPKAPRNIKRATCIELLRACGRAAAPKPKPEPDKK